MMIAPTSSLAALQSGSMILAALFVAGVAVTVLALSGAAYGVSPMKRLAQVRLDHACELLTTTTNRIGEVGEQLGFSDPYYFSRVFKKVMGVSPKSYR